MVWAGGKLLLFFSNEPSLGKMAPFLNDAMHIRSAFLKSKYKCNIFVGYSSCTAPQKVNEILYNSGHKWFITCLHRFTSSQLEGAISLDRN